MAESRVGLLPGGQAKRRPWKLCMGSLLVDQILWPFSIPFRRWRESTGATMQPLGHVKGNVDEDEDRTYHVGRKGSFTHNA